MAKQKVPGGKLLIVKVSYGDRIDDVRILGDFFIHPEGTVSEIEKALHGIDANSTQDSFERLIGDVAKRCSAEMIGVSPAAIAQTLKMAMG